MKKYQITHSLLLLLTAVIWGTAFVAQTAGMDYIGPFTFGALRFLIGSIVLIPVILLFANHDTPEINRNSIKGGICCGLILFAAAQLQQVAMLHASTGKAGFMTALYIVIVPLLGLFLGKKSTPLLWISVLLSVLGLYFLCIGIGGTFTLEAWDFMLIGCAFLFSIHILVIDHFNVKANCIKLSCIQFLVAGILNLPFLFLLDGPAFQLPPSLSNIFAAWLPVLYAGVLSSGVAYTLQIVGQKGMNPTVSSLILSLESVTAAVAGVIILKQSMSVSEALGCIIMFCAIILAQLPMPKKK